MKNDQLETMLTARQVADFLQVSISTVRRWSDKGMVKFYRVGSRGDRRYQRRDVIQFLEKSYDLAPRNNIEEKEKKATVTRVGMTTSQKSKRNLKRVVTAK